MIEEKATKLPREFRTAIMQRLTVRCSMEEDIAILIRDGEIIYCAMSLPESTLPTDLPGGLKRRIFAAVTLIVPIALLVMLELGLRIFRYGPDISLFTPIEAGGKTYLVMNPGVGKRYFPGTEFSPATSLDAFEKEKPTGTFRIFCLGGSTTVGYPYWFNAAFSTFLRYRLHALFPDRSIEVINLGLTATNSFTVLDIARDLSEAGPDLIIVYDGHNEFYGALGVASRESPAGARWLTDLSLKLLRFRTYRLLRDMYLKIGSVFSPEPPGNDRGTMMERLARGENIPMGSRLFNEALATFRENLRATADLCSARGIPLVLGTQVSNVRRQAPFVTKPRPGMTAGETREFDASFGAGASAFARGEVRGAIAYLRRAIALDSLRGDVQFTLARCLDSTGEKDAARRAYIRAKDLDQLRFRASSEFNGAIRAMQDDGRVAVVDMEALFAGASPDSIVGNELIFEHLHPRARGYFMMAKAYAHAMASLGLLAPPESWRSRDTTGDDRLWAERPITRLDDMMAERKVAILTSGWPFRDGVPTVPAVSPGDTLGQIAEQVTRSRWTWERAHEEALAFYTRRGNVASEEEEYRAIVSQTPLDIRPQLSLAHFYMERGRLEEMRRELLATLAVEPTKLAYRALGDLALGRGQGVDAIAYYRNLLAFTQSPDEQVENGYLLGLAFAQTDARDSARAQMKKLLALNPGYAPAAELLKRIDR
jgi:tetratricopeptide (TPR) repeat protein